MTEYGEPAPRGVTRLEPDQVRTVRFATTPWRRDGLDADQVYAFLGMVADELDHLHRDIAVVEAENGRIKEALRAWQTQHTNCNAADPRPPSTPGRDPVIGRVPGPRRRPCGSEGGW